MTTKKNLDKTILKELRQVYKAGTKVTAVNVMGIPQGKVGYIIKVEDNGNILLKWDTGEECTVLYEKESVSVVKENLCQLKRSPDTDAECSWEKCKRCGWNRAVADERKRRLTEEGLKEGKDGLLHFAIRSKKK